MNRLIGYFTAAWSLIYGILGLYWTAGGSGFPFGIGHDPNPEYSALAYATVDAVAPVISFVGFSGAAAGILMARTIGRQSLFVQRFLAIYAWCIAVALLLLVPDYRTLASFAYVFLLKFSVFNWTILNQFLCIAGGFLWAITAVVYKRQIYHACGYCGRSESRKRCWTEPAAAARWGKRVTLIAVFVPMVYTTTRIAWAFDIPLLVSSEFLHSMNAEFPGIWWFGAGLGLLEIGGSILTLGLIRRWGEIFPRWTLGLSGKRVPPALAIVPAAFVSVLVLQAGLMMWRIFLLGGFAGEGIGTYAPSLLWPAWGLALGAATLAYYYRRRGRCKSCRRGGEAAG